MSGGRDLDPENRLSEEQRLVLDQLAAAGTITRARLPKAGWTWRASGLGLAPGTATRLLDELRRDR